MATIVSKTSSSNRSRNCDICGRSFVPQDASRVMQKRCRKECQREAELRYARNYQKTNKAALRQFHNDWTKREREKRKAAFQRYYRKCDVCDRKFLIKNKWETTKKRCSNKCQIEAKRRYSVAYTANHIQSKKKWVVQNREPIASLPSQYFTRCYNCSSAYQPTEKGCPVCGASYDKNRCLGEVVRSQKSYADIVKENAKRAGKDPKEAMLEIQRQKRYFIGTTAYKKMYKQISDWQEKRKKKRPSN